MHAVWQFFNSYSSFFYMAFVADNTDTFGVENQCLDNDCMKAVAFQLGTIFVMHITVQQILEVILPYVNRERWSLWLACKIRCSHCCKPKSSEEVNILRANMEALTDEEAMLLKPHYIDTIEDFSELGDMHLFFSIVRSVQWRSVHCSVAIRVCQSFCISVSSRVSDCVLEQPR